MKWRENKHVYVLAFQSFLASELGISNHMPVISGEE